MMQHFFKILLLGSAFILGACGQQGSLYFPKEAESTEIDTQPEPAKDKESDF